MVIAIGASAFGSILVPAAPEFTLDEPRQIAGASDSPGSNSAPSDQANDESSERESLQQLAKDALSPGGTSSSGTSNSSSGGNGGVFASALDSVAAIHVAHSAITGWVSGEQRLLLPTSPGNLLLRPPQGI